MGAPPGDGVPANGVAAPRAMTVWRIARADGTRVGTFHWRYGMAARSALDVSEDADTDEVHLLRLVVGALVIPLVSTR